MPNEIGPHLEQRVIAFALTHPGFGPRQIAAELRRPTWGGIGISEHGVWRVLCRFGLNTRAKRLALTVRHRDPYERRPVVAGKELHIDASRPGQKVQMECLYIGRLSGTKGTVWQYTACEVASGYAWAFLKASERNPVRAGPPNSSTWSPASSSAPAGGSRRSPPTDVCQANSTVGLLCAMVRFGCG